MRLIPVVAFLGVVVPSVVQAQVYVLPSCTDPAVIGRSSYLPAVPCVTPQPLPQPLPPTGPGPVGKIVPMPVPPAAPSLATYQVPLYTPPVYVVPAAPSGGIDPWIPLAGQPAPIARSGDLLGQILFLQQLAAARQARQPARAPAVVVAPAPSQPTSDGWMSGFIKGVKPAE